MKPESWNTQRRFFALAMAAALLLSACGTTGKPAETETHSEAHTEAEASISATAEVEAETPVSLTTSVDAETPVSPATEVEAEETVSVTAEVSEDTQYKYAVIALSEAEFESAGFQLGDSCDLVFSNGFMLDDVPYYNGYYVKTNAPVLVAYPGEANLIVTYNYAGIWEQAGLSAGDSVTITRNEAGKYSAIQDVLGQSYSFDRSDYDSDAQFCNFRPMTGGALKEDFLYRGATPFDSSRNRASVTDPLLEANGIRFILDLADSDEEVEAYLSQPDCDSPYAAQLYADGRVAALDMSSSFGQESFQQSLVDGLRRMMAAEGPVYIHCTEGKDRTGFVCTLLEALAGASYEEMRADYMLTYANYYSVTAENTPEKYQAIADLYFDSFVSYLHNTEDKSELEQADYTADAAAYLKAGGMMDEEIQQLTAFITK